MSLLAPADKAELLNLATHALPLNTTLDKQMLGILAELASVGCQAKDVKDFLRLIVAKSQSASALLSSTSQK